jgi:hypothetical protein
MPEYELSLDPSKRHPKVDVKKSAKKAAENESKRLEAMRERPIRDTSKDFRFKYDGNNADHKELLGHLMNNGLADDIIVDDRGVASFPRRTFIQNENAQGKKTEILQPLMQKIQAGGIAANIAARKSEKTAPVGKRPTPPGMRPPAPLPPRGAAKKESNPLIEDKSEVMRNLFGK